MNTKRFKKTLEKMASPSSSDGEPLFLEIFLAAFRAVAKLFVMCAFGAFARRKNLLSPELTKNLSSLNGTIFLPCLLVTSIGASVTLEKLQKLWLLPVAACFNVICGYAFGRVLVFGNNKSNTNNNSLHDKLMNSINNGGNGNDGFDSAYSYDSQSTIYSGDCGDGMILSGNIVFSLKEICDNYRLINIFS